MAQNPFEQALVDEGLVGTPLESLARSIYMQESSGGRNTKTSNAGAVGGMQILPGTFNEMLPGGNINDPYDNSRAGLRYIKKLSDMSGGDPTLTAAGYYGGPGGMQKAKQGVAVSDPRNPNAPTTLEYAKQVLSRTDNKGNVSRETLKPESVIADAGEGYQAAYALMSMADEEPETTREAEAREAQEYASAAQQFSTLKKQLSGIKSASPFTAQGSEEPQNFKDGGEVEDDDDDDRREAKKELELFLKKATREESPLDVKFTAPPSQPMVVEGLGVQRGAPPSVQGRVGYQGDNFRMGASGVAVKTPQGVKYMPGMYDVGYRTPMAGGELDMSYMRGMKTMPGMPTPQMANVRYVRKFEKGGEAQANETSKKDFEDFLKQETPYEQKDLEGKIAHRLGLSSALDAANRAPSEMGFRNDAGTKGDAVRHMVLMRGIEQKYGPYVAKTLGYAHEVGNVFDGKTNLFKPEGRAALARDWEMDTRNNALGLELSKQAGGDEAKFRELMAKALADKQADYYAQEYSNTMPSSSGNFSNARKMLKEMPKEGVRKRAGGSPEEGEVSGRTFEEGGPETAKKMLKDVARGVSYYPYDLVGAPVDIINLGLKGVDWATGSKLATEKPVGGSADLIDRFNKIGVAEKPTGSVSEEVARLGSAFINPAAGARATGRVLSKAGDVAAKGAEKVGLEATRAITKNPDVTAAQMYEAMLGPQGPVSAAVRPKGGVFLGAKTYTDTPLTREDEELKMLVESLNLESPQGKAIGDFFDKKVRKYLQNQKGTPDDPVFNALLQGRIQPRYLGNAETWQAARAGDPEAIKAARMAYDAQQNRSPLLFEEALAKKQKNDYPWNEVTKVQSSLHDLIKKQAPGEPIGIGATPLLIGKKHGLRDPNNIYERQAGVQEIKKDLSAGSLLRMLNNTDLPPHIRQAAASGEPVFTPYGGIEDFHNPYKLREIKDYLATKNPEEIKNMGFIDAITKSDEWHADLANKADLAGPTKYTYKEVIAGTEPVLDTKKGKLNWVQVKTKDALEKEGELMGHCIGGPGHCEPFVKGDTKVFSLRDVNGMPHTTVEIAKADGKFNRIVELKGRKNSVPSKYFDEVDEFLNDYQGKLGDTRMSITEEDRFLPQQWRSPYTPVYKIVREDEAGAQVRYFDRDGAAVDEYMLRDDPRFPQD